MTTAHKFLIKTHTGEHKNKIMNAAITEIFRENGFTNSNGVVEVVNQTGIFSLVDCWKFYVNEIGTYNGSVIKNTSYPMVNGDNSPVMNWLRFDQNTAYSTLSSNIFNMLQFDIKEKDLKELSYGNDQAKNAQVSFYVMVSKAGEYATTFEISGSQSFCTRPFTISSDEVGKVKRITQTIPPNTDLAIPDGDGKGIEFQIWFAGGSAFVSNSPTLADDGWQPNFSRLQSTFNGSLGKNNDSDYYLVARPQLVITDTPLSYDLEYDSAVEKLRCAEYSHVICPGNTSNIGNYKTSGNEYVGRGVVKKSSSNYLYIDFESSKTTPFIRPSITIEANEINTSLFFIKDSDGTSVPMVGAGFNYDFTSNGSLNLSQYTSNSNLAVGDTGIIERESGHNGYIYAYTYAN